MHACYFELADLHINNVLNSLGSAASASARAEPDAQLTGL